jgi:hypothetical protein
MKVHQACQPEIQVARPINVTRESATDATEAAR